MILLVDDEPRICKYLKRLLNSYELKSTETTNPYEALTIYQESNIDLVLLDIKMPILDGFELYEKLKEIDPNVKVVFLTAYDTKKNILKALRAKSLDFYSKDIIKENEIRNFVNQLNYFLNKENCDKIIELLKQRNSVSVLELGMILSIEEQEIIKLINKINNSNEGININLDESKSNAVYLGETE